MVLAMIKRNMLTRDMFEINEAGCFLNTEARKIYLQTYNKKLRSDNQYFEDKYTYRESIRQQYRKYASVIMHSDITLYEPLELR